MEQRMLVDPNISFTVDLTKRIEVELSDERLEPVVSKELRKSLGL
jgi:hypothetical protein